jgi:hypothetical protein
MPRTSLLLAAVVALAPVLRAEDPAPAPAPAAVVAHTTRDTVNTPWVEAVRGYAKEKGLAVSEQGAGPVRYLLVGGANPGDTKHPLELAQKALLDLEASTGMQETFTSKNPAPEEIYWLAVFNDNGQVSGMIDYARGHGLMGKPSEGEDLVKKLLSFSTKNRVYVVPLERVRPLFENWSVYATVCLAVDAFYGARDPKRGAPTWLREGLAAEEQRLLCKSVRCTTIAYEDKQFPMSDDWRSDVAKLMRSGDRQNKIATELVRMPLDSLPNVFYQQMWSLCTFVRGACGASKTKSGKNKFREILDTTASGESSEDALKAVFGKTDPALTSAWRQWAQSWK